MENELTPNSISTALYMNEIKKCHMPTKAWKMNILYAGLATTALPLELSIFFAVGQLN